MTVDVKDTITPFLRALATDLKGNYLVRITPSANTSGRKEHRKNASGHERTQSFDGDSEREATNLEKLTYLAEQGRDFVKPTPQMLDVVMTDLQKTVDALLARDLPVGPAFRQIGNSVRKHIVWRFAHTSPSGPPDVKMPALSPEWIAHKGHANIGIYNRHLSESIAEGQVTTEKVDSFSGADFSETAARGHRRHVKRTARLAEMRKRRKERNEARSWLASQKRTERTEARRERRRLRAVARREARRQRREQRKRRRQTAAAFAREGQRMATGRTKARKTRKRRRR